MIKAFLKSLEDPNTPLFDPNYWLMNKIGLLLPKKFQHKIWNIIIHAFATFFVFSKYMELFVIRLDIDLVITNLNISKLCTICVIKANTSVFRPDNCRQVIYYITVADKFERDNQDENKDNVINSYTEYCYCVTNIYWALVFTTFVTTVTKPLINYYSSLEFREGFLKAFPRIFSPFDKENYPGSCISVLSNTRICVCGATIVAAYDTSVLVILEFFGGKLELLRIRCREMLGMNAVGVSDKQADKVVRQLHRIHVLLLKHSKSRLFNSVLSSVIFFDMVTCSLLICASAYQLTNNEVMRVVGSEPSTTEQRADSTGADENRSHLYTAGPFTNLTLPTFVTILKGAYSFYTLLCKNGY